MPCTMEHNVNKLLSIIVDVGRHSHALDFVACRNGNGVFDIGN